MGTRRSLDEEAEKRLLRRLAQSLNEPIETGEDKKDSEPAFYGDDYFIITEGQFRGRRGKYRSNPDGTRSEFKG